MQYVVVNQADFWVLTHALKPICF